MGERKGPDLSGEFQGPVAVNRGEAVDLRGSQGAVYKPSGPVFIFNSMTHSRQASSRIIHPGQIVETLLRKMPPDWEYDKDSLILESDALLDPNAHRSSKLEFLDRMEKEVVRVLRKSRDERFVELSMQLLTNPDSWNDLPTPEFNLVSRGTGYNEELPFTGAVNLIDVLNRYHSLVMLGAPGSGKSTMLQYLALMMIGKYRREESLFLPLYVPLTGYVNTTKSILEFLEEFVTGLVGKQHFITRNFDGLVKLGGFLLLLDGLDQLPERCSEQIRLARLEQVEPILRRLNYLYKITEHESLRLIRSIIVNYQQYYRAQLGLVIDPREREIEKLSAYGSMVIASCRSNDFIGTPNWQCLQVMPLSQSEIDKFLKTYVPDFELLVSKQWNSPNTARVLISNPFYLRRLSNAYRVANRELLMQASAKKGKLLEFVIRQTFKSEMPSIRDEEIDEVLFSLGKVAYYMLQRNVTGPLSRDEIKRLFKSKTGELIKIALRTRLIIGHSESSNSESSEYIEFSHQIFLEFLLAFYLKRLGENDKRFQESLALLACQGEKWAESTRLLFEMLGPQESRAYSSKLIEALQNPDTWDIATRTLSEIGQELAPRLALLLKPTEKELTRRGILKILGSLNAIEYTRDIVALSQDNSWQIRRAAVQALVKMKLLADLKAFESDKHELVIREVWIGKLTLERVPSNVLQVVNDALNSIDVRLQIQIAWAIQEVFDSLLEVLSYEQLQELLHHIVSHEQTEIKTLGYIMLSRAPDWARHYFKEVIIDGALNVDDEAINILSRRMAVELLTEDDLCEVQVFVEASCNLTSLTQDKSESDKCQRAVGLLIEMGLYSSCLEKTNVFTMINQLSKSAAPLNLAILTWLLADPDLRYLAVDALVKLEDKGIPYLLAALDDPLPDIRCGAADFLKLCYLPEKYARKVRKVLRENHSFFYCPPILTSEEGALLMGLYKHGVTTRMTFLALPLVAINIIGASIISSVFFNIFARGFGANLGYKYWLQFSLSMPNISKMGARYSTIDKEPRKKINSLIHKTQRCAFWSQCADKDPVFWLARGRFLSAIGDIDNARAAFTESLAIDPEFVQSRYEHALLERKQGNVEQAIALLSSQNEGFITSISHTDKLYKLLTIEKQDFDNTNVELKKQHLQILIDLELWDEALARALTLYQMYPQQDLCYYHLYLCYKGMRFTRRALAAAIVHNNSQPNPNSLIPSFIIDNLRILHRDDKYNSVMLGKIGVLVDLHQDKQALQLINSLLGAETSSGDKLPLDIPKEAKEDIMKLFNRNAIYSETPE